MKNDDIYKDDNMDINYNIINNNYLNYISRENNNFFINYDLKNKLSKNKNIRIRSPEINLIDNNNKNNQFKYSFLDNPKACEII